MAYKILIVDDEPDLEVLIRQKFRRQVREGRFELSFAGNGQEALEKLDQDTGINVVLSDINMPVMDGLTLLSRLADVDRLLKSVIVSAYGDMENIRTAMNRGAFDFVTKPIDFEDLEITINKTIDTVDELKQAEREREQLLSLRQELSVAARIQMSILPRKFPAFPGRSDFDVFADIVPAKAVGGDFYDFFLIDEERLGFVIGDVSGKGVPAAILMAVTRTLLRATALQNVSAGQCLQYVNSVLAAQNENSMFVTIFYGILYPKSGMLEYSCAGHNPPYLFSETGVEQLETNNGIVAGIIEDATYETQHRLLTPGQGVLLYTDGVSEAEAGDESFFEEKRIEGSLKSNGGGSAEEVVRALMSDVREFAAGAPQSDDITVFALRRTSA